MQITELLVYIFLILGSVASAVTKKLTIAGAFTGFFIGLLIYLGAGFTGLAMLALFFVLGSAVTGFQLKKKLALGLGEKNKGQRTAGQVIANGGMAAILGGLAWVYPHHSAIYQLMIAGSLAAATADTLSSELGMVWGRRFINIITFKQDHRGLDGVISLEGTLAGIGGAILIANIYATSNGWGRHFIWIVLAGLAGTIADSVLGATLERKGRLGNDSVNFLNTLTGALFSLLFFLLFN